MNDSKSCKQAFDLFYIRLKIKSKLHVKSSLSNDCLVMLFFLTQDIGAYLAPSVIKYLHPLGLQKNVKLNEN